MLLSLMLPEVFQSAGHNDETTEKSLLCVKEGSMKLNARGRFIGKMGVLFWFHLDFTCGCNLCHTIMCQFTQKISQFHTAAVNGLSCDTMSFLLHGPVQRSGPSAVI